MLAHLPAGILVAQDLAGLVAEVNLTVVVTPLHESLLHEDVIEHLFAPVALHLVVAPQCAGQVLGGVAQRLALLREVPDRFIHLGLERGRFFRVLLFLSLESLSHRGNPLVEAAGDVGHQFAGRLFQRLFALAESLFALQRQLFFRGFEGLCLRRLHLGERTVEIRACVGQALCGGGRIAGPQRFLGLERGLCRRQFPGIAGLQREPRQQPGQKGGHVGRRDGDGND